MKHVLRVSLTLDDTGFYLGIVSFNPIRKVAQPYLDKLLEKVISPAFYGEFSPFAQLEDLGYGTLVEKIETPIVTKLAFFSEKDAKLLYRTSIPLSAAKKIDPETVEKYDETEEGIPDEGYFTDRESPLVFYYEDGELRRILSPDSENIIAQVAPGRSRIPIGVTNVHRRKAIANEAPVETANVIV